MPGKPEKGTIMKMYENSNQTEVPGTEAIPHKAEILTH